MSIRVYHLSRSETVHIMTEQSYRKHWVTHLFSLTHSFLTLGPNCSPPVSELCPKTEEQVPTCCPLPLIITERCSSHVCVRQNWIWQTILCSVEMERDGAYSPQINQFVCPVVIVSGSKMLLRLRWTASETLNVVFGNRSAVQPPPVDCSQAAHCCHQRKAHLCASPKFMLIVHFHLMNHIICPSGWNVWALCVL